MLIRNDGFIAAAGAVAFEIINAGLAGVMDRAITPTSHTWTTAEETTLLVACFTTGKDKTNEDTITAMTFNGVAMTLIGEQSASRPRNAAPGQSWWYLKNPAIGALALAYILENNVAADSWDPASNCYGLLHAFNIRGENASPIGASNFPGVSITDLTSRSGSITTTAVDSLILSAGSFQGYDTQPLTALNSLTKFTDDATGTGHSGYSGVTGIGWKAAPTVTSYDYGWSTTTADGGGVSAVEIKKA